MGRIVGGSTLLVLAALMLLGFLRSDASIASPTTLMALLLVVVLPAACGIALLRGRFGGGRNLARVEKLRQQTIEAEILRLAMQHQGRLTAVEVATALALPSEAITDTLDAMVMRELAEMDITDDGVMVYTFHDARHLQGKHGGRGMLNG